MVLLFLLLFAPVTSYVDVHGKVQPLEMFKKCPQTQHIHTPNYTYPVYDATHKTVPVMKAGDGRCHFDANDKVVPKSVAN